MWRLLKVTKFQGLSCDRKFLNGRSQTGPKSQMVIHKAASEMGNFTQPSASLMIAWSCEKYMCDVRSCEKSCHLLRRTTNHDALAVVRMMFLSDLPTFCARSYFTAMGQRMLLYEIDFVEFAGIVAFVFILNVLACGPSISILRSSLGQAPSNLRQTGRAGTSLVFRKNKCPDKLWRITASLKMKGSKHIRALRHGWTKEVLTPWVGGSWVGG